MIANWRAAAVGEGGMAIAGVQEALGTFA